MEWLMVSKAVLRSKEDEDGEEARVSREKYVICDQTDLTRKYVILLIYLLIILQYIK